jgi:DNA invertase Pin-like site-specific DNA recombinase
LRARAFDRVDVSARQSRHTRHSLQKIQRDALASQQNVGVAFQSRKNRSRRDFFTFISKCLDFRAFFVEMNKHRFGDRQSANDEIFLREKFANRAHVVRNASLRRNIAAPDVFG